VVPGSSGTIQVASPQGNQAFASWSDGGAQQHNIVAPTTDTTYTATFATIAPTVAGLSETSGPTAGGRVLTLTGTNFAGGMAVSLGGVAATAVTVRDGTTATLTTPAHAAGAVDVTVTTAGGSATLPRGYTYGATANAPGPRTTTTAPPLSTPVGVPAPRARGPAQTTGTPPAVAPAPTGR